jgi:uncharacterized protein (TIGR02147 family)
MSNSIMNGISYELMLKEEYLRRKAKNSAYSTRSFSRDLGISQPYLHQLFHRKRNLSDEKALVLADRLKWGKAQKKLFGLLVRYAASQDPEAKALMAEEIRQLPKKNVEFFDLKSDEFSLIADWYCYALLELTTVESFEPSEEGISRRLGISKEETKSAIARLKRLGLLETKGNRLIKIKSFYKFGEIPSAALKRHHMQSMDLAKVALNVQDLDMRDFSSVTFGMDTKQIQQAKAMIAQFRRNLMTLMEDSSEKRAVYKMSIQLFRLDKDLE